MGGSSKKQTVGYKYYLGLHAIFTHGPVDSLTRVFFDKKLAFDDTVTTATSFGISKNNLFGGEDVGAEGGVAGVVDWCPGYPTQPRNTYLQSKLGTEIPAFRGVSGLVFNDFYFGTSKYIKQVSARMTRIHKTTGGATQWYDEKAEVLGTDSLFEGQSYDLATTFPTLTLGDPTYPPIGSLYPATLTIGPFSRGCVIVAGTLGGTGNATADDFFIIDGAQFPGTAFQTHPAGTIFKSYLAAGQTCIVQVKNTFNNFCGATGTLSAVPFSNGDMNPAHIIRECLIDPTWGMGYQAGDIDDDSFEAAADTLYSEGFGLSLLWDRQMQIEQFIGEIIKHIDGALYIDRQTGLFTLQLIRGDYDVESLPLLDESNIDKIEGFSHPVFGELVNSVTVNFWDAKANQDSSVTIGDPALIQMQQAVINTTLQYPGITNPALASRVGMRDLTTLSNPLVSCTIYANSIAEPFRIGSVFLFSWEDYGIVEMPMRVTAIAYGDGVKNAVKMTCTQDVFKLPATGTITPPSNEWEDPNQPAAPVTIQYAEEMTYFELVQRQGQSDVDARIGVDPNIGLTAFACSRPQSSAVNALVYIDAGSGYEQVISSADFAPSALLAEDIGRLDTTFTLKTLVDETLIEVGTYATFVVAGVSGEKVYVADYDDVTNEITVRRGCLDTVPQEYLEDTRLMFDDVYQSSDNIEYVESDSVNVKLLTSTGSSVVDIENATAMTIDFDSRAARPYPPADVKVQGQYWPTDSLLGTVNVTWVTRNRRLQTSADLIGWTDPTVIAEDDVEVAIEVYDEDTETLLFSDSGITSPFDVTSHLVLNSRIELFSVNTVTSLESFNRVIIPVTYGQLELTDDVPNWSVGNSYSHTAAFVGGSSPFTWSIESGFLPDGLTLNSSTGQISGTPSVAGVFAFKLRITDNLSNFDEVDVELEVFEDPLFANVVALLHCEGVDASTTFTDEKGKTWTASGTAQIDTAQFKFGGASYLDNTTTSYIQAASDADFGYGTGDFVIEFWHRPLSLPTSGFLHDQRSAGGTVAPAMYVQTDGTLRYHPAGVDRIISAAGTIVLNTWKHIALAKINGSSKMFVDGSQVGSTYADSNNYVTSHCVFGNAGDNLTGPFGGHGHYDEIRVTKGSGRGYSANFTPVPYPFPNYDFVRMVTENADEQEVCESGEINLKENPRNV